MNGYKWPHSQHCAMLTGVDRSSLFIKFVYHPCGKLIADSSRSHPRHSLGCNLQWHEEAYESYLSFICLHLCWSLPFPHRASLKKTAHGDVLFSASITSTLITHDEAIETGRVFGVPAPLCREKVVTNSQNCLWLEGVLSVT